MSRRRPTSTATPPAAAAPTDELPPAEMERRAHERLAIVRDRLTELGARDDVLANRVREAESREAEARAQAESTAAELAAMPDKINAARARLLAVEDSPAGPAARQHLRDLQRDQERLRLALEEAEAAAAKAASVADATRSEAAEERALNAAERGELEGLVGHLEQLLHDAHLQAGRDLLASTRGALEALEAHAQEVAASAAEAQATALAFRASIAERMTGYPELGNEVHALLPVTATPAERVLGAFVHLLDTLAAAAGTGDPLVAPMRSLTAFLAGLANPAAFRSLLAGAPDNGYLDSARRAAEQAIAFVQQRQAQR